MGKVVIGTCFICKRERKLYNRKDKENNKICNECYVKHMAPKEICSKCNVLDTVRQRDENNLAICKKCYDKTYKYKDKPCSIEGCNNIGRAYMKDKDGKFICEECYNKHFRKREMCSICKETNIVKTRDKDKQPICPKCYVKYFRPQGICIKCKKLKKIYLRDENKTPLCRNCAKRIKYKEDEIFRITILLRNRITKAINLYSKTGKVMLSDEYGIDYDAIIKHLGPCPGNREEYHIDHKLPLDAFDFDDLEQIKLACAPENHQWLKVKDNLQKGAKYDEEELENYLNKIEKDLKIK